MRSTAKPGTVVREPGEERDVATERQALVADLRGRGEDDVVDPLGRQLRVAAEQLAHGLDAPCRPRASSQKKPLGPARPNAVRTPSTKTTSRSSRTPRTL